MSFKYRGILLFIMKGCTTEMDEVCRAESHFEEWHLCCCIELQHELRSLLGACAIHIQVISKYIC